MNRALKLGVLVSVLLLFIGLALSIVYSYSSISQLIANNDRLRADLNQVEALAEDANEAALTAGAQAVRAMDTADNAYEALEDLSSVTLDLIENYKVGAEDVVWFFEDEEVTLLEYVINEDGKWQTGIADVWLSCNDQDINLLDFLNTASVSITNGIRCPVDKGLGEDDSR